MPKDISEEEYKKIKVCAELSNNVYYGNYENPKKRPSFEGEWVHLADCSKENSKDGYFGMAYYRLQERAVEVIIAHDGTISVFDVEQDIEMWIEESYPDQFNEGAKPFTRKVHQDITKRFQEQLKEDPTFKINITHTGHSLGAVMSDLSTIVSQKYIDEIEKQEGNNNYTLQGITFENPGTKKSFNKAMKFIYGNDTPRINPILHTFNASTPNLITTSSLYLIDPCCLDVGFRFNHLLFFFTLNHSVEYTLEQHKIINFLHYFKKTSYDHFIKQVRDQLYTKENWPSGILNYEKDFIDYGKNKEYWDEYIDKVWEECKKNFLCRFYFPRLLFLINKKNFKKGFIKHYLNQDPTSQAKKGLFSRIFYARIQKNVKKNLSKPLKKEIER